MCPSGATGPRRRVRRPRRGLRLKPGPDRADALVTEQAGMSSQSIRIMCPNLVCRKVLAVPQAARGKTVRCRNCGTTIRVPSSGEKAKAGGDAGRAA